MEKKNQLMKLHSLLKQLKSAKLQSERELSGINQALEALAPKKPAAVVGPRLMTAAGRKAISIAQKRRWALIRGGKKKAA